MLTEEVAKLQCKKRKPESDQKIAHAKEARLVDGQVPFNSPSVSSDNEPEGTIIVTNSNLNSPANDVETNPGPNVDSATCMFTPCDEGSQKFMCSITNLPLAVKHCLKPSKPLGKPSKLIDILGDGNCLFRALSYAVSGRQVYHTQMRAQIINHMYHIENFLLPHMNRSLHSYLANSHMTRNGVWGTDIEIFSVASLLSTDIFVYTQFGETQKWLKFSRTMIGGKKPANSCSIYLNHSNRIHYDVVQDVSVTDLKHQFSQNSKPDGICNYDKEETIAKKILKNTCYTEQRQTKCMFKENAAKPQSQKRKQITTYDNTS